MEQEPTPLELTPEQAELADYLLSKCPRLTGLANVIVNMNGESGTVLFGLGRCGEHIIDMTPDEISDMVLTQLAQQQADTQGTTAT